MHLSNPYFRIRPWLKLVMPLSRPVPLPQNPCFREGYWLLHNVRSVKCDDGGEFLVEYDVALRLAPETARKQRREFSDPLSLYPKKNGRTGRWDLELVIPVEGSKKSFHVAYHRLVGLVRCKTRHGLSGRNLFVARVLDPKDWWAYEVNHQNWCTLDCREANLRPWEAERHRSEGRLNWRKRCLSHSAAIKVVQRVKLRRTWARLTGTSPWPPCGARPFLFLKYEIFEPEGSSAPSAGPVKIYYSIIINELELIIENELFILN